MELTRDQFTELVHTLIDLDVIDGEGDALDSYMGRSMYGATCLGFAIGAGMPRVLRLGAGLAEALNTCESLTGVVIDDLIEHAELDSLGLGTVLYLPGVTVEPQP